MRLWMLVRFISTISSVVDQHDYCPQRLKQLKRAKWADSNVVFNNKIHQSFVSVSKRLDGLVHRALLPVKGPAGQFLN